MFNFHKPEEIDLDGECIARHAWQLPLLIRAVGVVFEAEVTTNYTALVTMTILLLPHFLKLSVRSCRSAYAHRSSLRTVVTTGSRAPYVHCSHHFWARSGPCTLGPQLRRYQSCRTQLCVVARLSVERHQRSYHGDHTAVSLLLSKIV